MVDETYRFDEASYDALGRARVGWQQVIDVLHARPRVRQQVGSVLRVAAADRHGRWLVVAMIEESDGAYLVVGAREPDPVELAALEAMVRGERDDQP